MIERLSQSACDAYEDGAFELVYGCLRARPQLLNTCRAVRLEQMCLVAAWMDEICTYPSMNCIQMPRYFTHCWSVQIRGNIKLKGLNLSLPLSLCLSQWTALVIKHCKQYNKSTEKCSDGIMHMCFFLRQIEYFYLGCFCLFLCYYVSSVLSRFLFFRVCKSGGKQLLQPEFQKCWDVF